MFGATAVLPCQHKPQPLAVIKWQIGSRVIAIKQANGKKLNILPFHGCILRFFESLYEESWITYLVNNCNVAGATQTIDDTRLTLQQDGDLVIKSIAYGDAGDFYCIVINNPFMANVKHTLNVECKYLVIYDVMVDEKEKWMKCK